MAVAAGIIGGINMTAIVTYIRMKTIGRGAAMTNSIHDIELIGRELVALAILISVKVENIGDFALRS